MNIIGRLDNLPCEDRYDVPLTIFARRPWSLHCPAVVLFEDADEAVAPSMPEYSYMLEVEIAKEVLEVWSQWRGGATPTASQATEAVIHYATKDAYQPLDG